jgi:hypothetical protein
LRISSSVSSRGCVGCFLTAVAVFDAMRRSIPLPGVRCLPQLTGGPW